MRLPCRAAAPWAAAVLVVSLPSAARAWIVQRGEAAPAPPEPSRQPAPAAQTAAAPEAAATAGLPVLGDDPTRHHGLGPAASKVYAAPGVSVGGYAEFHYARVVGHRGLGDESRFAAPNLALYAGARLRAPVVLHLGLGVRDGDRVAPEFATLDVLFQEALNLRAGLVLVPVGLLNEDHEPASYFGNARPLTETLIIPTTWTEWGVGVFGEPVPGVRYRAYLMSPLRAGGPACADGEPPATGGEGAPPPLVPPCVVEGPGLEPDGWRNARQGGADARGGELAAAGRLDYDLSPGTRVGASVYYGQSDHAEVPDQMGLATVPVTQVLAEGHGVLRSGGLELRALAAYGRVLNAGLVALNTYPDDERLIGGALLGVYVEAGYDVMPSLSPASRARLLPWLRVEKTDTQAQVPGVPSTIEGQPARLKDVRQNRTGFALGVTYYPAATAALKVEYNNVRTGAVPDPTVAIPDEDRLLIGGGFMF